MGLVPQEDLQQLAQTPPEPVPLSFGEGVAAVFEAGRLTDQSTSTTYQLRDELSASMRRLGELGGPKGEVPWPLPDATAEAALNWLDSHKDTIASLRSDPNGPPDPFLKTGEEIRQGLQKRTEEARSRASRAGIGAQLVGGAGVAFTDPLNLALLPLGVAGAETLLARMAGEAVIGAGSQALVEAASSDAKTRAGVEDTMGDKLGRIAFTGALAGGLGGVFHGIGRAVELRSKVEAYRKAVAEGTVTPNRATEAAADAIQDHLDTVPPQASPAAEAAHLDATAAAVDVLQASTPEAEAMAMRRLKEREAAWIGVASEEDRRIASMTQEEWLASRPKADAGTEPTIPRVLLLTGVDPESKGVPGVSKVDANGSQVVYVYRDGSGDIRGALNVFLDETGNPDLASIAVDPSMQRMGIGGSILAAARRDFPNADASLIQNTSGLTDAGARLRYRDAVERVAYDRETRIANTEAFLAREAESPRSPIIEPSVDAPSVAFPTLPEADRVAFDTLTTERPNITASFVDSDGIAKAGTARELMMQAEEEATTIRDILACVLKGGPG